ncbi:hypothetical protein H9L39_09575 [Fusarium oxysporum f. sp. albedinis]|nr:hypothetical protein H9L39_09575 [Fusarium oxysporum f. sp. albedinis]
MMIRLFTSDPDNQASPPHGHVVTINASINRNTFASQFAPSTRPQFGITSSNLMFSISPGCLSQQIHKIYASPIASASPQHRPDRNCLAESLIPSFSIQNLPR